MSVITAAQVRTAAKGRVNESNLNSVMIVIDRYGSRFGLDRPHRLAQLLAQVGHESGDFRYDREIWGPTPAQARYDTRTDLGNTAAKDGDGKLYMGRTEIQITGKANYQAYRDWCRKQGLNPPDFVASPDLVNTDPWEGLAVIWYWETRTLNRWADQGDIETITKRINGGMNGFADRVDRFGRLALVVLGYNPTDVGKFQAKAGLDADGDVGPKTRAALHQALVALIPGEAARPEVKAAPVTEEKAVVPVSVDKQVKTKADRTGWLVGIGGTFGTAMTSVLGAQWQTVLVFGGVALVALLLIILLRSQIVSAIKDIRDRVEE